MTGRNFKKIFLQWLLRHAIITLFEKNLRNYAVNMIKKKDKVKISHFWPKNSDNSKTPLSISVFFGVYITSHETNTWVKKFWKKNTIFFFLYFWGGFYEKLEKIYIFNLLKCGRQTHCGKLEGFTNILSNFYLDCITLNRLNAKKYFV